MSDDDISIEEKRVFSSKSGTREVFVAAGVGVVVVSVSDDRIGGFGVDHHCTARDVAGRDGRIAVATDEDVLLAPGYQPTGFGPAHAVGLADDVVVAVDETGRVSTLGFDAVLGDEEGASEQWQTVGHVDGPRAVDGRLVASGAGVFRVSSGDLQPAGLDDVHDVAAAGPFAATASGLFYLGNGWMEVDSGVWTVVDAADATGESGRAHAAGEAGVYEHTGTGGEWQAVELPLGGRPVGFAYDDDAVCAVAEDGTFLVDVGDGPRTQLLGLRDVGGIAVP